MEEEDDEEMEEEDLEEMEEGEDEKEEEIIAEDEAEIIYPYDEEDPNNQPPPALDDESEFAPSVIPVFDAENRPVPPVIYFSCTYERGESSPALEILKDIGEVYPFGLVPLTIGTAMKRIKRLNEEFQANVSKVNSMMESMSLEFDRVRKESYRALELVEWEAGARNAAMTDDDVEADDVKDDDSKDDDDMDDDSAD
nr:hypothetical protein [Tanacetum cinerariifolium]